jgi:hypothetical protein
MATAKEIFFTKNNIKLALKYSILRRLSNPITNGNNFVLNGDFASAEHWNAGSNITINTGTQRAIFQATNNALSQNCGLAKSTWYRVEFDVLEYQQGKLQISCGNESAKVVDVYQGHFSVDVFSKGDASLYLTGVDTFAGSVSNLQLYKLFFYEENWQDVTKYTTSSSLNVSRSFDFKSWEFGEVTQDNCNLKLINLHGEISDEDNPESLFSGYVRHYSKLKIEVVFNEDEESKEILFLGLLDDRTATTEVESSQAVIENITAFSFTKILTDTKLSELGTLSATTINTAVYELLNRGIFTDYFTVNSANISAGVNATIDLSVYSASTSVLDVLKDIAKGHSAFYIDVNNNFIFKAIEPTESKQATFDYSPERKLKIYDYSSGSERVIEKFYWDESSEKFEVEVPRYNTSETISIDSVLNSSDRQSIINYLGAKFSQKASSFKVDLPLCPFLNIFDRVGIVSLGAIGKSFILNISKLDVGVLENPIGAIIISDEKDYFVSEINHSGFKTTITVQEIKE